MPRFNRRWIMFGQCAMLPMRKCWVFKENGGNVRDLQSSLFSNRQSRFPSDTRICSPLTRLTSSLRTPLGVSKSVCFHWYGWTRMIPVPLKTSKSQMVVNCQCQCPIGYWQHFAITPRTRGERFRADALLRPFPRPRPHGVRFEGLAQVCDTLRYMIGAGDDAEIREQAPVSRKAAEKWPRSTTR